MKLRFACLALMCAAGWTAAPASGAVSLSSLNSPTLQTLINLGSTGVTVGTDEFSNFSFIDLSTADSRTASQVRVLPLTTAGPGVEFVSGWITGDGSILEDLISFDVQSTVANPIGKIGLTFNGTAPVPAAGTFTSASLLSQTPGGSTAAPVLSTYNDGITSPVDTTHPDVNSASGTFAPQTKLQVIDTLIASSAPEHGGSSGLATVSILQNSFVSVPEPSQFFGILLPSIGMLGFGRRRVLR